MTKRETYNLIQSIIDKCLINKASNNSFDSNNDPFLLSKMNKTSITYWFRLLNYFTVQIKNFKSEFFVDKIQVREFSESIRPKIIFVLKILVYILRNTFNHELYVIDPNISIYLYSNDLDVAYHSYLYYSEYIVHEIALMNHDSYNNILDIDFSLYETKRYIFDESFKDGDSDVRYEFIDQEFNEIMAEIHKIMEDMKSKGKVLNFYKIKEEIEVFSIKHADILRFECYKTNQMEILLAIEILANSINHKIFKKTNFDSFILSIKYFFKRENLYLSESMIIYKSYALDIFSMEENFLPETKYVKFLLSTNIDDKLLESESLNECYAHSKKFLKIFLIFFNRHFKFELEYLFSRDIDFKKISFSDMSIFLPFILNNSTVFELYLLSIDFEQLCSLVTSFHEVLTFTCENFDQTLSLLRSINIYEETVLYWVKFFRKTQFYISSENNFSIFFILKDTECIQNIFIGIIENNVLPEHLRDKIFAYVFTNLEEEAKLNLTNSMKYLKNMYDHFISDNLVVSIVTIKNMLSFCDLIVRKQLVTQFPFILEHIAKFYATHIELSLILYNFYSYHEYLKSHISSIVNSFESINFDLKPFEKYVINKDTQQIEVFKNFNFIKRIQSWDKFSIKLHKYLRRHGKNFCIEFMIYHDFFLKNLLELIDHILKFKNITISYFNINQLSFFLKRDNDLFLGKNILLIWKISIKICEKLELNFPDFFFTQFIDLFDKNAIQSSKNENLKFSWKDEYDSFCFLYTVFVSFQFLHDNIIFDLKYANIGTKNYKLIQLIEKGYFCVYKRENYLILQEESNIISKEIIDRKIKNIRESGGEIENILGKTSYLYILIAISKIPLNLNSKNPLVNESEIQENTVLIDFLENFICNLNCIDFFIDAQKQHMPFFLFIHKRINKFDSISAQGFHKDIPISDILSLYIVNINIMISRRYNMTYKKEALFIKDIETCFGKPKEMYLYLITLLRFSEYTRLFTKKEVYTYFDIKKVISATQKHQKSVDKLGGDLLLHTFAYLDNIFEDEFYFIEKITYMFNLKHEIHNDYLNYISTRLDSIGVNKDYVENYELMYKSEFDLKTRIASEIFKCTLDECSLSIVFLQFLKELYFKYSFLVSTIDKSVIHNLFNKFGMFEELDDTISNTNQEFWCKNFYFGNFIAIIFYRGSFEFVYELILDFCDNLKASKDESEFFSYLSLIHRIILSEICCCKYTCHTYIFNNVAHEAECEHIFKERRKDIVRNFINRDIVSILSRFTGFGKEKSKNSNLQSYIVILTDIFISFCENENIEFNNKCIMKSAYLDFGYTSGFDMKSKNISSYGQYQIFDTSPIYTSDNLSYSAKIYNHIYNLEFNLNFEEKVIFVDKIKKRLDDIIQNKFKLQNQVDSTNATHKDYNFLDKEMFIYFICFKKYCYEDAKATKSEKVDNLEGRNDNQCLVSTIITEKLCSDLLFYFIVFGRSNFKAKKICIIKKVIKLFSNDFSKNQLIRSTRLNIEDKKEMFQTEDQVTILNNIEMFLQNIEKMDLVLFKSQVFDILLFELICAPENKNLYLNDFFKNMMNIDTQLPKHCLKTSSGELKTKEFLEKLRTYMEKNSSEKNHFGTNLDITLSLFDIINLNIPSEYLNYLIDFYCKISRCDLFHFYSRIVIFDRSVLYILFEKYFKILLVLNKSYFYYKTRIHVTVNETHKLSNYDDFICLMYNITSNRISGDKKDFYDYNYKADTKELKIDFLIRNMQIFDNSYKQNIVLLFEHLSIITKMAYLYEKFYIYQFHRGKFLFLQVNRENILDNFLNLVSSFDLKKTLKENIWYVTFGTELCAGIGPTLEFFTLFGKCMNRSRFFEMFKSTETSYMNKFAECPKYIEKVYFYTGIIMAKCIIYNTTLGLEFIDSFYLYLTKDCFTFEDLKICDSELHKSLSFFATSGKSSFHGYNFTWATNNNGIYEEFELVENGCNISLTSDNLEEYLQKITEFKLFKRMEKYLDKMKEGFCFILGDSFSNMFNYRDLSTMLQGEPDFQVEDFKQCTSYVGDYNSNHPVIIWFWNYMSSLEAIKKKKLFLFLTTFEKIPFGGFKSQRFLEYKFTIMPI
ncbi:putative E3 ubiquitin-protein ligase HERC3 [Hamiltosporidium magnivora]|uniref:HECT-type E3 ubiquitin transferase n=1 Tax=Hamiltosporidium magnivora TaxID=148818 RepID=A0A4Q9LJZ2_9MICR|nr:putative E3 ubiquitin-protein ligase HERC3 [Hamiltosporidium magnivora]